MSIMQQAIHRWPGILQGLGIDQIYLQNKHGPCPICAGKDRFRFDDKDGRGTWFCNQCGAGDGIDLIMKKFDLNFKDAANKVESIVGTVTEQKTENKKPDPAKLLRKIHAGLVARSKQDPVSLYLASRGLVEYSKSGIQYHPSLGYYESGKLTGQYPAMVCTFRNSAGKPISYHVTYLTNDGQKAQVHAPRKMMTPTEPMPGGSISLHPAAGIMGIAEGVETALAASMRAKIPVWAASNAGMLEQWEPPTEAKEIIIFGDNDENFTGQASAYRLANRLSLKGYRVVVSIPENVGDWNDELLRSKS